MCLCAYWLEAAVPRLRSPAVKSNRMVLRARRGEVTRTEKRSALIARALMIIGVLMAIVGAIVLLNELVYVYSGGHGLFW